MNFDFTRYENVPVISGDRCVIENGAFIEQLGSRAYIVTGKNSAKACGALDDVITVLDWYMIPYVHTDRVTENPPADMCYECGKECREYECDFIIAIGGGSAMDAAKAISIYAANDQLSESDIYIPEKITKTALPIIAIPTTAGTGSEANGTAVLTIDGSKIKKSVTTKATYPKAAYLDARYTTTLSEGYTVSTALDALCHAIESYLSPKSNELSRDAALYAIHEIWAVIFNGEDRDKGLLDKGGFTFTQRERLLNAAAAAGVAISYTGTGFPHPLGYSLTLDYGTPHGSACALFEGKYLEYNYRTEDGKKLINDIASAAGCDVDTMIKRIPEMARVDVKIAKDERESMIDRVAGAKNYKNSPYNITRDEMSDIYTAMLGD